jgi:AcrR family transcriptional regulator
MAYEVTKVVHGRPYRYRVRSERDPVTGKFRNRWTYLGRVDPAGTESPVRLRRDVRNALLDALDRLLVAGDPESPTAAAIAGEAGVAHGTFYRYFRNKQDAIVALVHRVRDESSDAALIDAAPTSRDQARSTLRAWAEGLLRTKERHRALISALYALSSRDEALLAMRRERREAMLKKLCLFFERCDALGFAEIADPLGTTHALQAMIVGFFGQEQAAPLDDARVAAMVGAIERVAFGRL